MATTEVDPGEQTYTWCESGAVASTDGGAGDVDPDGGSVQNGWPDVSTPPTRQRFNWVFKYLSQAVRFLLHIGIPNYLATRNYAIGDRAKDPSTQLTYQALLANGPATAVEALTNATYWARWGFSGSEIPVSGALADGTITPSGTSTVAYARRVNFPRSSEAIVACRLCLHNAVGGYAETLTLSGAALFATGIDGVGLTIEALSSGTISSTPTMLMGTVVSNTSVQISVLGYSTTDPQQLYLDVQIRGH